MRTPWPHPVPLVGICFLPGATLVRLHGPLLPIAPAGTRCDPAVVDALSLALAAAHRPVVVNVAAVSAIDTDGLRWLMRLTRRARSGGEALILESPTRCVDEVLALTGCRRWFSAATRPGPRGRSDTARLIQLLPA